MKISEINIYPVKSLRGTALIESTVEERGLQFDRRWMLVDEENRFLTQREHPKMATITVDAHASGLTFSAPGAEALFVPASASKDTVRTETVKIWGSTVKGAFFPGEVNKWFSDLLGLSCRLVYMPAGTKRIVSPNYAVRRFKDVVSFADGYPFLLIGQASLDDLNSRLAEPVPMNRFRPNFVVSGAEPFAEDSWKKVRIGETVFHVVKPCARCVITTVDQATGEKTGKEPLATIAKYRNVNGNALFGQNLIADEAGGVVRVGDEVEALELAQDK